MSGPSPEQVEQWITQIDDELLSLQQRLEPLQAEQSRLQERRVLLKELLGSFSEGRSQSDHTTAIPAVETTRERVHRQALEVFSDVGHPLHSNDLHSEFVRRGFDVPGAGKPNNITVHLTNWPDISSPERGIYGTLEMLGDRPKPSAVRRRRKRGAR